MDGTTLGIAGTRPTITVTLDGTAGAWDGAGATPTIVDGITVGIIPTITEAGTTDGIILRAVEQQPAAIWDNVRQPSTDGEAAAWAMVA